MWVQTNMETPAPPGDPPYLEPAESPSKWKLVEELRRMRRQGGP